MSKKNSYKILDWLFQLLIVISLIWLFFSLISFKPAEHDITTTVEVSREKYILVTNGQYEAMTVYIWYNSSQGWVHAGSLHIPGQGSKSFDIGNEMYTRYGFTTKRRKTITLFYSGQYTIY